MMYNQEQSDHWPSISSLQVVQHAGRRGKRPGYAMLYRLFTCRYSNGPVGGRSGRD
jgi:hypothetical protein